MIAIEWFWFHFTDVDEYNKVVVGKDDRIVVGDYNKTMDVLRIRTCFFIMHECKCLMKIRTIYTYQQWTSVLLDMSVPFFYTYPRVSV